MQAVVEDTPAYTCLLLRLMFTSGNAKASYSTPAELASLLGATRTDWAIGRPLALHLLDVCRPSSALGDALHDPHGPSPGRSTVSGRLHLFGEDIQIGVRTKHEPLIRVGCKLCKPFPELMLGNGIKGNLEHLALVCVEENIKVRHCRYCPFPGRQAYPFLLEQEAEEVRHP
jgi:hypothetical protein